MVQRDTGRLSQSTVDGLQRQKDIAIVRPLGVICKAICEVCPGM